MEQILSKFYAQMPHGYSNTITSPEGEVEWDHQSVIEVLAVNPDAAVHLTKKVFGNRWSMIWNSKEIDLLSFNKGVIARLGEEGLSFPKYTYAVFQGNQVLGTDGKPLEEPKDAFSSDKIFDLVHLYDLKNEHKIKVYDTVDPKEHFISERPGDRDVSSGDASLELSEVEAPQSAEIASTSQA